LLASKLQEELRLATQSAQQAQDRATRAAGELADYQSSLKSCAQERNDLVAQQLQLQQTFQQQEQLLTEEVTSLKQEKQQMLSELQQLQGTRQHMLEKLEMAKTRLGLSEAEARAFVQVKRHLSTRAKAHFLDFKYTV
jgi:chromosome segregation ATPase